MKKLLAILLSMLLLCGMLPLGAITAAAADLPTIEVGVETEVNITEEGQNVDFLFTPTVSGYYEFGSYGDKDTYGYILDADEEELARDDDSGEGNQFLVGCRLEAGETYILRAEFYDWGYTGSFPVLVTYVKDGFSYDVTDGQATITGYRGEMPAYLDIPATIDGYPVTAIGNAAFASEDDLRTVMIPEGVTYIGAAAFCYCDYLESIIVPVSVTYVGSSAVDSCYCLTDIYYTGTEDQRWDIDVFGYNDRWYEATWHYEFDGCIHRYDGIFDADCNRCGEEREILALTEGEDFTVTITNGGQRVDIGFIPTVSGFYTFGSYGSGDTYGSLLDANGNQLADNDDGGEDNQFLMKYYLEAGQTYILRAAYLEDYRTGSFPVRVDLLPVESVTIKPLTVYENIHGYKEYFGYCYNIEQCTLLLTYTDGTVEEITEYVSTNAWEMQYDQLWVVGNTYTVTAEVMGVTMPMEVTVAESPIAGIVIEDVEMIEYSDGHWDGYYDENDNWVEEDAWFYYYVPLPKQITVTLTDGTVYSGRWSDVWEQMRQVFGYSANNYYRDSDQSYDNPWTLGENTARLEWLGETIEYTVNIIESPIESVVVEPISIIQYSDGYWYYYDENDNWVEDAWFYYYAPYPQQVTVTLTDGTVYSGGWYEVRQHFYDLFGEDVNNYNYYGEQSYNNPWTLGENTAYLEWLGLTFEYTVNIIENPIESVVIEPVSMFEHSNGYWDGYYDENGNWVEDAWFHYYVPTLKKITVTLNDGTVYSGGWYDVRDQLCDLFGDDVHEYHYYNDQSYDNPWTLGENTAYLEWLDQTIEYTVVIKERSTIEFGVDTIVTIENVGEEVDLLFTPAESGFYSFGSYGTGDTYGFICDSKGNQLAEDDDIDDTNRQFLMECYLTAGETYVMRARYYAEITGSFPVRVERGNIQSVAVRDVEIIENTHGYEDDFGFVYEPVNYTVDITYLNGDVRTVEYYSSENNAWDLQREAPWVVGGTYTVTVMVMGYPATVNVSIVEVPIARLEVPDVTLVEGVYGYKEDGVSYYSFDVENPVVTLTDGTVVTGNYFVVINGENYDVQHNGWELQNQEPWVVGGSYTVTAELMGVTTTFEVHIVPSPIASFTVENLVLYEGFDGYEYENGVSRYPVETTLTQLTVKDGETVTLNDYGYEYYGQTYHLSSNGWDIQWDEPWTAGNTYTVTAELMGVSTTFTVTILENPVAEIVLAKMPDKTIYRVGESLNLKGATFRVIYTDGTHEDIAIEKDCTTSYSKSIYLEKLDRYIDVYNYGRCDTVGSQIADVELCAVNLTIPVMVQENPIESITIREDADKSIIITVHNTDGTTRDMKILDIPWGYVENNGEGFGAILTDAGEYMAHFFVDDDSFALGLSVTDDYGDYILSNTIGHSDWLDVAMIPLSSSWYFYMNPFTLAYNRVVTAENIDAVAAVAMYRGGYLWNSEYENDYYVVDADLVREAMQKVFGISDVDLSLSQYYDAENNIFRIYDWVRSGDEVNKNEPGEIRYEDGIWYVTAIVFGKTVYLQLDEDLHIVAAGINATIPPYEPVEPDQPEVMRGDADGNGKINNRDLARIQQYITGWISAEELDLVAADVDGNGKINNRDLARIQQYITGWIDTLE